MRFLVVAKRPWPRLELARGEAKRDFGVDAAIRVVEVLHQRLGDRQVPNPRRGIDFGRRAPDNAFDDLELSGADPQRLANQLELAPGRPTTDIEIAPEAQRIDRRTVGSQTHPSQCAPYR